MPNYPGRTKGTRRIVVWHDGKRHEKVVRGTRAEAADAEARWKVLLLSSEDRSERRLKFCDFCDREYIPHAKTHLKESTWRNVRAYQVTTLIRHLGGVFLDEFGLKIIETYKADRLNERLGRYVAGPQAINNELRLLGTILGYARSLGHEVPALKWAKLPVRRHPRVRCWTEQEIQRIYEATSSIASDLLPMIVFLINTGCRKGEAIAAEWSWVDFESEMLRIPSNDVWQPKNGMPREIPLSDAVRAVLADRRHDKYLFPRSRGGGRYLSFPKDLWDEIRRAAGVIGGPHTTRHTFASHFLRRQPDLFLLSQILGHSHARVTELYSHLLPDHLARARNAVNLAPALRTVAATVAGNQQAPKKVSRS